MAKKNKLPDISHQDPLKPFDITQFGNVKADPCFGKGYDLSTKECKRCGDSELCAFVMSQRLNISRKELEEKNHYKDLDVLEDVDSIKKFMRRLKRSGLSRKDIINKTCEKFEVPTRVLRKIYKELK